MSMQMAKAAMTAYQVTKIHPWMNAMVLPAGYSALLDVLKIEYEGQSQDKNAFLMFISPQRKAFSALDGRSEDSDEYSESLENCFRDEDILKIV